MDRPITFTCKCKERTYLNHECRLKSTEIPTLEHIVIVNLLHMLVSTSFIHFNHKIYGRPTLHALIALAKLPLPELLKTRIVENLRFTYRTDRRIQQTICRILDDNREDRIYIHYGISTLTTDEIHAKFGTGSYKNYIHIYDHGLKYFHKHIYQISYRPFAEWLHLTNEVPHICSIHLVPLYKYFVENHALFDHDYNPENEEENNENSD